MEENQNVAGKFLNPGAIIAQLNVRSGSVAADFGSGPGYFSIPFAKAVGEEGRVYSFDILPQALETVIGKARNSGVANITTKRVNLEKENGTTLEAKSVDWVILKGVLFQNQKKEAIIAEAYRILKSGGRMIVVEWNQEESAVGPAKEVRVPQDVLEEMLRNQQFKIEKNVEAGDFHYALVAVKN
jgi:ubiquinone/menaquinone biosynthesis C-methylase UbiE